MRDASSPATMPLPSRPELARAQGWAHPVLELLDRHLGIVFLLPGLLCLLAVIAYPILFNLAFGFTNKDLVFPTIGFVGVANYVATLNDTEFWHALLTSISWTAASVVGQLVLGLAAALALDRISHGRTLLRMLLIVPWAFPAIVMAFVWRFMLDPLYGIVNYFLIVLHVLAQPMAFHGTPGTALPSVVLMNVWFGFPFMTVAIVAALQGIPREHYEVAQIEGAEYWQELVHVILPAIRGVLAILVVLRTIWVFNNFDFIYLTTAGGPINVTETLPIYAFTIGWLGHDIGRMAAISTLMLIVLSIITSIYFRLLRVGAQGQ